MHNPRSHYASAQLLDACRLLFPGTLVHPLFLEQLDLQHLKSAFRARAKEYHPDSCIDLADSAHHAEQFRLVTAAYEQLAAHLQEKGALMLRHSKPAGRPLTHSGFHPRSSTALRPRYNPRQNARKQGEQYYHGPLPTFRVKTGLYLYYRSAVSYQDLVKAIIWQRAMRPPFGELACSWGWLTPYFVSVICSATDIPGSFGERALKLGLLNESQIRVILLHQRTLQSPIGRYFVENGIIAERELHNYLRELVQHNKSVQRVDGEEAGS